MIRPEKNTRSTTASTCWHLRWRRGRPSHAQMIHTVTTAAVRPLDHRHVILPRPAARPQARDSVLPAFHLVQLSGTMPRPSQPQCRRSGPRPRPAGRDAGSMRTAFLPVPSARRPCRVARPRRATTPARDARAVVEGLRACGGWPWRELDACSSPVPHRPARCRLRSTPHPRINDSLL